MGMVIRRLRLQALNSWKYPLEIVKQLGLDMGKIMPLMSIVWDIPNRLEVIDHVPMLVVDLLQEIYDWSDDDDGKCIFWLRGMAGTGKSTISRTVAQAFDTQERLGASFFFKRGEHDRENASLFFTTVALDLV
ncbi:hypothetical protein LTR46_003473 [Exophiala xenobiotica]|nr:hypothetical protein LTR46_003473 [Exophiala xenobiotica]